MFDTLQLLFSLQAHRANAHANEAITEHEHRTEST